MNLAEANLQSGKTLIDQLIRAGVSSFCLCPGFRSTPLAMAVAEDSRASTLVHFDERGAAFHALGYAKASGKPTAVVVTSGTAVGNLMPAVMEASAACVPLILLTCDRPKTLQDTMANQTTDQLKLFAGYTRSFFDMPTPCENPNFHCIATTAAQAVHRSQFPLKGPVQINCPFAEPFFGEKRVEAAPVPRTQYSAPNLTLSDPAIERWAEKLQGIEKGVILLGGNASARGVDALAKKLDWPIFADVLSGHRSERLPQGIPYFHHILKSSSDLQAEAILHFGDACVSKEVLRWMDAHRGKRIIHVASHSKRCDPAHVVTDRIVGCGSDFCKRIEPLLKAHSRGWSERWKERSRRVEELLPSLLGDELNEPNVLRSLEGNLFIGNSMPIRDADMFLWNQESLGAVFANRGLSGIDGNVATAAGIAEVMPLTAVMGDQTLLHDLNSLGQLKKTRHPLQLVVINNGGGGIFSFVAIGKRKDLLDPYFSAAHETQFEQAAKLFDLPYVRARSQEELFKSLDGQSSCLIEVTTDRTKNHALHLKVDRAIQEALCSSSSTVS